MKKTDKKLAKKLRLDETTVRLLTQGQIVIGGVLAIGHCTNMGCSVACARRRWRERQLQLRLRGVI
jgi:hypothetical protein